MKGGNEGEEFLYLRSMERVRSLGEVGRALRSLCLQ